MMLCVGLVGCAHAPPDAWPERRSYLGDARVVDSGPVAFSPIASPSARSQTGELALQTTGAAEQARATALRFARALLEGDAATLTELLSARIALTIDGTQKPRDELIERCLKDSHALVYATEHDPSAVLDLGAMRVERADLHHDPPPLPIGIDPADLTVTLPVRDAGDDSQRRIPCMTTLYVRTGLQHQVVGIAK